MTQETLKELPKIELHCHLDGSLFPFLQKSSFRVRVLSHSVRLDGPKPFGNISFKV